MCRCLVDCGLRPKQHNLVTMTSSSNIIQNILKDEKIVQVDEDHVHTRETDPFNWYPPNMQDKQDAPQDSGPPTKKARSCVILGDDGEQMSYEEFLEEHDWIDGDVRGAMQDELNEVYEKFGEKPIDFLSTFQPKDPNMRLYWSYLIKDGRELVARTKASVSNFKYNEKYTEHNMSMIPECIICGCKFLMSNVYVFVYEYNEADKMTARMKYSDSMEQASFVCKEKFRILYDNIFLGLFLPFPQGWQKQGR